MEHALLISANTKQEIIKMINTIGFPEWESKIKQHTNGVFYLFKKVSDQTIQQIQQHYPITLYSNTDIKWT